MKALTAFVLFFYSMTAHSQHPADVSLPMNKIYWSQNRAYFFKFQKDGNLVAYKAASKPDNQGRTTEVGVTPLWASNTTGRGAACKLQHDGVLVVYGKNKLPVWTTGVTPHVGGCTFGLSDEGSIVVFWKYKCTYVKAWSTKDGARAVAEVDAEGTKAPECPPPPPLVLPKPNLFFPSYTKDGFPCKGAGCSSLRMTVTKSSNPTHVTGSIESVTFKNEGTEIIKVGLEFSPVLATSDTPRQWRVLPPGASTVFAGADGWIGCKVVTLIPD